MWRIWWTFDISFRKKKSSLSAAWAVLLILTFKHNLMQWNILSGFLTEKYWKANFEFEYIVIIVHFSPCFLLCLCVDQLCKSLSSCIKYTEQSVMKFVNNRNKQAVNIIIRPRNERRVVSVAAFPQTICCGAQAAGGETTGCQQHCTRSVLLQEKD